MEIIINEENLKQNDIEEISIKVRAMLINNQNELLIANYGDVLLLPGGKLDNNESLIEALKRELLEETGINYDNNELTYLTTLNYFQKDYPKRNGTTKNRIVKTHIFFGQYKEKTKNTNLTEKEQKDNFSLELIPLELLKDIIKNNTNNNPRNIYFQKELQTILEFYKNYYKNDITKILKPR